MPVRWSGVFFFFQAEDGIRYLTVTGVQTCALPITNATSSSLGSGQHRRRVSSAWESGQSTLYEYGRGFAGGESLLLDPGERPGIRRHRQSDNFTDRKSTRLNSSHSQISYAVFCLK